MPVSFSLTWKVKKRVECPTHKEFVMGKKLYVGNMSYEVDSSALEQMFTIDAS